MVVACGSSTATTPPFDWTVDLSGLEPAVLSVTLSGGEAVAVGGTDTAGFVLEWNGAASWRAPLLPADAGPLWWVWPVGNQDYLAVGQGATILRRHEDMWNEELPAGLIDPTITFYGIWGSSANDVWVVGGTFTPGTAPAAIFHFDGLSWSSDPGGMLASQPLFKVWGTTSIDVWAVGYGGEIFHYDGTSWSPATSGISDRLVSVWGRSADDVFAVGGDSTGVIVHYDGMSWSPFATTLSPLAGVWTAPGQPLYVAGNDGFLARYASAGAMPETAHLLTDVDFHSLTGDSTRVIAVGADLSGSTGTAAKDGALAVLGQATPTMVTADPAPDASPIDAPLPDAPVIDAPPAPDVPMIDAPPADASPFDASIPDAAIPDAPGADAAPGPGQMCTGVCTGNTTCLVLVTSGVAICTQACTGPGDCTALYGAGACCAIPGPQTITPVCVPATYLECQ